MYDYFYVEWAPLLGDPNIVLPELKFIPTVKKFVFPLLMFFELSRGLLTNVTPEVPTSKDGPFGIVYNGQWSLSFLSHLINYFWCGIGDGPKSLSDIPDTEGEGEIIGEIMCLTIALSSLFSFSSTNF